MMSIIINNVGHYEYYQYSFTMFVQHVSLYIQSFIWGSVFYCLRGIESCLKIVLFHILLALRLNVFYVLRTLSIYDFLSFLVIYGTQKCLLCCLGSNVLYRYVNCALGNVPVMPILIRMGCAYGVNLRQKRFAR